MVLIFVFIPLIIGVQLLTIKGLSSTSTVEWIYIEKIKIKNTKTLHLIIVSTCVQRLKYSRSYSSAWFTIPSVDGAAYRALPRGSDWFTITNYLSEL